MCGAPKQGGALAGIDLSTQTVIQGQVWHDGAPVAGAYVRLLDTTDEFTAEVVTSPEGEFRFFAAPGEWKVRSLAPVGKGERVLVGRGRPERDDRRHRVRPLPQDRRTAPALLPGERALCSGDVHGVGGLTEPGPGRGRTPPAAAAAIGGLTRRHPIGMRRATSASAGSSRDSSTQRANSHRRSRSGSSPSRSAIRPASPAGSACRRSSQLSMCCSGS